LSEFDVAKSETLSRLAQTREELRRVLASLPESEAPDQGISAGMSSDFPRSRTMKALLTGRGMGTLGAMLGGVMVARPALALRLVRLIPTGTIARMLLGKAVSALRARRGAQG